ncbi:AI-2E family transporter [Alkaliphilus pronyensis]|nr:AI-2E family transporter [Alkaliphilus pronyensis]
MIIEGKLIKHLINILLVLLIIFLLGQIDFILIPLGNILFLTLLPIVFGGLFYYILRPLVAFLVGRKVNKTAAVVIVLLGLIVAFSILIVYGSGSIREEFSYFYVTFSEQLEDISESTKDILDQENYWIFSVKDLESKIINASEIGLEKLGESMTGWISIIANVGTVIVLIPIVIFFLLKDDELFYNYLLKLIPKKHKETVTTLFKDIDQVLSIYITGQLIVALFLGILTYIGYLIIGLPNALILAIFSMITSIIPFLGPFLGVLPAIIIGGTVSFFMIIKVLIVLIVTQQLEGSLVRPNIVGNRLQIHPLVVIFLVIIAIALYGFIGAFLVIPIYGVIRVIIRHFYGRYMSSKQNK